MNKHSRDKTVIDRPHGLRSHCWWSFRRGWAVFHLAAHLFFTGEV